MQPRNTIERWIFLRSVIWPHGTVWASWRKNQEEKEGRKTQRNKNKQQTFGRDGQIHLEISVLEKDMLTLKCLKNLLWI